MLGHHPSSSLLQTGIDGEEAAGVARYQRTGRPPLRLTSNSKPVKLQKDRDDMDPNCADNLVKHLYVMRAD